MKFAYRRRGGKEGRRKAVQSWSRVNAVPFRVRPPQFSAVNIACYELVLQRIAISSSGFHFTAGIVVWEGTALMGDHDCRYTLRRRQQQCRLGMCGQGQIAGGGYVMH